MVTVKVLERWIVVACTGPGTPLLWPVESADCAAPLAGIGKTVVVIGARTEWVRPDDPDAQGESVCNIDVQDASVAWSCVVGGDNTPREESVHVGKLEVNIEASSDFLLELADEDKLCKINDLEYDVAAAVDCEP